eukprot:TRINITY_DN10939_c0_g1_i2.p1 TRINITY_DN10939_c0_g1~~TRINITY_DN10939_c0_g1_i2.p1  ORF type:complete len:519 (-),score=108.45 TRINITY_DN10939_c0_g1_i2:268-1824(-)
MQFTQGLHRAAQQRPNAIATICNDRVHSFAELKDRVSRLASGLRSLGVGRGDRVCMLSFNSDRYLEFYLASAWIGAVVNPANFRWSVSEIGYSLADSRSEVLIVDDSFASACVALREVVPSIRHCIFAGDGARPGGLVSYEGLIEGSAPISDEQVGGNELFGIFYTGGTTGAPKGVMLSHLNVTSSALSMMAEGLFPEGAIGMHVAPMFHLADMLMLTGLLLRGASHVMIPVFKPDVVLQAIERHRVTDVLLVPTMLQMLVDSTAVRECDLSSLRRVAYGASPASEALLERAMSVLPNAGFIQGYGMTETAALISVLPADQHTEVGRQRGKLKSAGRTTYHAQVKIVDHDDVELPRGEPGEIIARGPGIMLGYVNKPEATASALKDGWIRTGDIGYMDDDGYIFIVDRSKDMIISGGENIYSVEVENAIAKHRAVAQCAVIGVPCPDMGEKVHATVVLMPGADLSLESLYVHCKALIAGYKCPRSLSIVEALPVSGAGKILKTELRKAFWDGRERVVS